MNTIQDLSNPPLSKNCIDELLKSDLNNRSECSYNIQVYTSCFYKDDGDIDLYN